MAIDHTHEPLTPPSGRVRALGDSMHGVIYWYDDRESVCILGRVVYSGKPVIELTSW
jgi:hypothetical protein